MTAEEAKGLVAKLMLAYPRQTLAASAVTLYADKLVPLPFEIGALAIDIATATYAYFPNLGELLRVVSQVAIGAPDPMEAWEQAAGYSQVVQAGYDRERDAELHKQVQAMRHPLVVRAMHAVGGSYAIRTSDNVGVIRAHFLQAYREVLERAHHELHTTGSWESVAALPRVPQQRALQAGG